jgi:membrane-bound lytic murein transglycosylase A
VLNDMGLVLFTRLLVSRRKLSLWWSAAIALFLGLGLHQNVKGNEAQHPIPSTAPSHSSAIRVEPTDNEPLPSELSPVLVPVSPEQVPVDISAQFGWDDRLWAEGGKGDRQQMLTAIDYSLAYLQTPAAEAAYANYPIPEFTLDRVQRSLERFRHLLLTAASASELQRSVLNEFVFYRSIGHDGQGTVDFTGYFEPTYVASRVPTPEYPYPLYQRPSDLDDWDEPHPTRLQLEGRDGLQSAQGKLRGYELVWLGDRLEAFLIQVQGSARLQLVDGTEMSVGYAGRTNYPYQSIGRLLIDDGHVPEDELSLPKVLEFFNQHPWALDYYLPQNNRFVFFRETHGAPPQGTLSVPVTAERSIATDKSIMPPGALAMIETVIPVASDSNASTHAIDERDVLSGESGSFIAQHINRYVLDQDTGGAIRGPGRVDVFMGTGQDAGARAGLMNTPGSLYYLLLNE